MGCFGFSSRDASPERDGPDSLHPTRVSISTGAAATCKSPKPLGSFLSRSESAPMSKVRSRALSASTSPRSAPSTPPAYPSKDAAAAAAAFGGKPQLLPSPKGSSPAASTKAASGSSSSSSSCSSASSASQSPRSRKKASSATSRRSSSWLRPATSGGSSSTCSPASSSSIASSPSASTEINGGAAESTDRQIVKSKSAAGAEPIRKVTPVTVDPALSPPNLLEKSKSLPELANSPIMSGMHHHASVLMPICEPSSEISPRSNSHNQFSSTPCQVREPLPGYQPTQDGLPERTMAGPIPFTFAQVEEMTRNFDIEGFLGEGGFGSVFKGYLPTRSGRRIPVAVKMLDTCGHQGEREWLTEVSFLGLLEHPNLVCLIGYCAEEDQRLLVYEFLPRGSLEFLLFGEDALANPLTWHQRLKIAFGAAEGLAYLHEEAEHQVIYRDFKTSNILLTNDLEVKLSDFGMAREGPDGEKTHVSTRVVGTVGYAAPEYVLTGHLTTKSDVYGFGVVLLELMTGRLALDKERPREEQSLVEWASPFLSAPSTLYRIMDPALRGRYSARGAQMVAAIVKECLQKKAKRRPKMSEVVAALRPVLDLHDMAGFCAEDMRAGLGGQVSPSMGGIGSIANNATGPQRFQRSESAGTLEEGAFKRRSISSSPKANADINAGDAVRVVVTMDGDCNQVPQACGAASRATITGNQKPRLPSPCQASPKGVISPNVAGSPWRAGRPRSLPAV